MPLFISRKAKLKKTDRIAFAVSAVGTAAVGYYLWRRWQIPLREHERSVDSLPPVEETLSPEDWEGERGVQLPGRGIGPIFHRRYRIDVQNPGETPETLMAKIQANPQSFAPPELANFEKIKGEAARMQIGDEYYIHILGPWDGPVRVIEVEPDHFTLITLDKHLEAGQIVFRTSPHPGRADAIRFEIESWARSRDKQVAFAYEEAKVARSAQTAMWVWFCNRVAEVCGGEPIGEIDVLTEKAPYRGEIIPDEQ